MFAYQSRWMRAGAAVELISGGPWDPDGSTCEYQLYRAVLDGEVHARLFGKALDDMTIITSQAWRDGALHALPFDLEVSVQDVYRIWDWANYELADLIAFRLVGPRHVPMLLETAVLNLQTLLKRVRSRCKAMDFDSAIEETQFNERWKKHRRDCSLLLTVVDPSDKRIDQLRDELYHLIISEKVLFTKYSQDFSLISKQKAPSNRGRKPTYDWISAKNYIWQKFEYHGSLVAADPDWSCQADVEREICVYFQSTIGKEPAASGVRNKAKEFIDEWHRIAVE